MDSLKEYYICLGCHSRCIARTGWLLEAGQDRILDSTIPGILDGNTDVILK